MGTRSLTYVYDGGKPVVCMYRQFDGYPSGHGKELAEFLLSGKMVNGLGPEDEKVFNGVECLAAQMVAHFKKGPGGIYLVVPELDADHGQEYEYHISHVDGRGLVIRVIEFPDETLFTGSPEEFSEWCASKE